MFDATGKILPGSSLQGAFIDMPGNVDSCLEVGNIYKIFFLQDLCPALYTIKKDNRMN